MESVLPPDDRSLVPLSGNLNVIAKKGELALGDTVKVTVDA